MFGLFLLFSPFALASTFWRLWYEFLVYIQNQKLKANVFHLVEVCNDVTEEKNAERSWNAERWTTSLNPLIYLLENSQFKLFSLHIWEVHFSYSVISHVADPTLMLLQKYYKLINENFRGNVVQDKWNSIFKACERLASHISWCFVSPACGRRG